MHKVRISKARWERDRETQEREWDRLVDKIYEHQPLADHLFDEIRDGLSNPRAVLARLELPELQILFLLAHLAAGEGLLRATEPGPDPDRGAGHG